MQKLKAVGFWREENDKIGEQFPLPVLSKKKLENKDKLISYLQSGIIISEWLGYSYCRFIDGPDEEFMGDKDLSDGVWFWPEGLYIYIKLYNILLPESFLRHIENNNFQIPVNLNTEKIESMEEDYSFWISWGKTTQPDKDDLNLYQTK